MIILKNVRQKSGFCGPASLMSLIDFYGTKMSQKDLAKICGTTTELGTSPENLIKALNELGFKVIAKANCSLKELEELVTHGTPVLVNWWSDYELPADGHYSLVYKMTKHSLFMMDPELGGVRRMSKNRFLSHWYDYHHDGRRNSRWCLYIDIDR